MSKENNLSDFLTNIADAIRDKKGTSDPINAQDFASEIESIETGGGGDEELQEILNVYERKYNVIDNSNIKSITPYMFYSFSTLTSISLPKCSIIGQGAFYSCNKLTSISIPKCEILGPSAFELCRISNEINLPLCKSLGAYTFRGNPIKSAMLPECEYIGNTCFSGTSLNYVYVPKCSVIEGSAFANCHSLNDTNNIILNQKDLTLGSFCFASTDISNTNFISNVENIILKGQTFYYCSKLTSATINNLKELPTNTFSACSKLSYIDLPKCSVIYSGAFYSISNNTIFNLPTFNALNGFPLSSNYVGDFPWHQVEYLSGIRLTSMSGVYSNLFYYSLTDSKFPKLKEIGASVGYTSPVLSYISLSTLESIGPAAFYSCQKLTYANIPNCKYLGVQAFYNCNSNLSQININKCEYIGSSAFAFCYKLQEVYIPECSYIGSNAFYNCSNLININTDKCEYLNDYVFYGCSKLNSISLPNCSYIGSNAFYSCFNLEYVSTPKVQLLGRSVFYNCSKLKEINLPECTTINKDEDITTYNTSNLTLFSMPKLQLSKDNATLTFKITSCPNLSLIYLPNLSALPSRIFVSSPGVYSQVNQECKLVLSSYYYAASDYSYFFSGFSRLTEIEGIYTGKPGSTGIQYLGDYAFNNCYNLKCVKWLDLSEIGRSTFSSCYNLISMYIYHSSYSSVTRFNYWTCMSSTPITGYSAIAGRYGSVFVPASMYSKYIKATNWAQISSRIVGIDEEGNQVYP